jgi:Asp-tRNA(Asn)/Glu-tRNA(Gln) amidotransferase A subunit family amidase
MVGIQSNAGFMSQTVDGVILGMQAFLKHPELMSNMDYKVVPLPWNELLFSPKKKLKIGYYTEDGYFPLTPACKRAVEIAIQTLDKLGCEVVYFKPPQIETLIHFFFDHILADGGANSLEMWEGEILDQV